MDPLPECPELQAVREASHALETSGLQESLKPLFKAVRDKVNVLSSEEAIEASYQR